MSAKRIKGKTHFLFTGGVISLFVLFGGIVVFLGGNYKSGAFAESGERQNAQKNRKGDLLVTPAWKVFRPRVVSSDPIRGTQSAPVDIVVFGGFGCAECKDIQPVLSRVLKEYSGMVRLVWKDFPDPRNPNSRTAARAARCAQVQGKFWQYHDMLFERQDFLSGETYMQIARELELDENAFSRCLASEDIFSLVGSGMEEAQRVRVDALPSVFVNGRRIEGGFSYPEIQSLIVASLEDIAL